MRPNRNRRDLVHDVHVHVRLHQSHTIREHVMLTTLRLSVSRRRVLHRDRDRRELVDHFHSPSLAESGCLPEPPTCLALSRASAAKTTASVVKPRTSGIKSCDPNPVHQRLNSAFQRRKCAQQKQINHKGSNPPSPLDNYIQWTVACKLFSSRLKSSATSLPTMLLGILASIFLCSGSNPPPPDWDLQLIFIQDELRHLCDNFVALNTTFNLFS